MKALVTGASGFVGRELCRHLAEQGDVVLPFGQDDPMVNVVDPQGVHDVVSGSGAEVLYHLAALSHAGRSFENAAETLRVNVEGTLNVLEAAGNAGIARVLVVGSADEYGNRASNTQPLTEESQLLPVTPYGVSKVAAEFLGLQAHLSTGLGTIMTRSFNHTGPGQSPSFVVPALAQRIAQAEIDGKSEIEAGRLDSVREFNDVRDIVRAYRLLILHGQAGAVYNVCSGVAYSIAEIAQRLLARATRPLSLRQDPSLVRSVESDRLVGNPAKLQSVTGWRPQIPIEETLQNILDEARARAGCSEVH